MHISRAEPKHIKQLITLFRAFYPKHDIFHQEIPKISHYLSLQARQNQFLVVQEASENNEVQVTAAAIIIKTGESVDKNHTRWKFRHFAFSNETAGLALLKECEQYVHQQSKTAKIELNIAESEAQLNFYKEHGYHKEATLRNHYRWGETCFVLGKSLKQKVSRN
ncbi:hypothetical protein CL619_03260 [archaeon]|nr:hypothetical protein [archaeon]|tara:strand:+ start:376 stop:870 length:495 start_codon:yes stop_codon:yes gene_type:complete